MSRRNTRVRMNRVQDEIRFRDKHGLVDKLPTPVHIRIDDEAMALCGATKGEIITRQQLAMTKYRPSVCERCEDVIWHRRKKATTPID